MAKLGTEREEVPAAAPRPDIAPSYRTRVWREGQRETVHSARRYSVFVKVMKGALPLATIALTVVVLIYAFQPRDTGKMALTFGRLGTINGDLAMINPRLTGSDNDGMPFVVTAASAVQVGNTLDTIKLNKVGADIKLKDGMSVHVTAAEGTVQSSQNVMLLSGGIHLTMSNGYDAKTEAMTADLRAGTVRGDTPIVADGAFGHVQADRFVLNKQTRELQFMGNVHMLIEGAQR